MRKERISALALIAIVVLWTAMPALACLSPTSAPHSCCHAMMQGCADSVHMGDQACCQIHAPAQAVPPTVAGVIDPFTVFAVPFAGFEAFALAGNSPSNLHLAGVTPSPPVSGASSILRI